MDISVSVPKRERPNIVLIVLDTLRADHLPMYGYGKPTCPFLEKLSGDGTVYLNAISPGIWTLPTHTSLFTGTYISTHQTHRASRYLPETFITLAQTLAAADYRCLGISNNAWVSSLTGLDRGFHDFFLGGRLLAPAEMGGEFVDSGSSSRVAYVVNKTYRQFFKWRYGDGAPWINRVAMKQLRGRSGDNPFFLFINYKEPHLPYTPPQRYSKLFLNPQWSQERIQQVNHDPHRFVAGKVHMSEEDFDILKALYDAEIRYVDDYISELFAFLDKRGHLENSLIFITADHGDNIGEHGLMGHEHCVYDTLARIPLIAVRPQNFDRGTKAEAQVQLLDIFATVLDIVGIGGEPRKQNQGVSLCGPQRREFTVTEFLAPAHDILENRYPGLDTTRFQRTFRAIRSKPYKLIKASDGSVELYNIETDPGELKNQASDNPEAVERLSAQLAAWVEAHLPDEVKTYTRKFDADIEDRLRDLGYL